MKITDQNMALFSFLKEEKGIDVVLPYLLPSLYCQSDELVEMEQCSFDTFYDQTELLNIFPVTYCND